jgi:hypothetical protein
MVSGRFCVRAVGNIVENLPVSEEKGHTRAFRLARDRPRYVRQRTVAIGRRTHIAPVPNLSGQGDYFPNKPGVTISRLDTRSIEAGRY